MAIALGAHTLYNGSAVDPATTAAITTTSGSTFYVVISEDNTNSITSVTDSKANTYVLKGTKQTAGAQAGWLYVCENGTGGASHTATVNFGASANPTIAFGEITGAAAASFDVIAQGTDSASPFTVASPTTTQANELLLAVAFSDRGGTLSRAESTGFTIADQATNGDLYWTAAVATKVVSATGVYTPSWTESGGTPSSGVVGLFIATFKASSGTAYDLPVDSGSYTLTRPAVGLEVGRMVAPDSGSYALSLTDVTLTHAPAASYVLDVDAAAFGLALTDAGLEHSGQATAAPSIDIAFMLAKHRHRQRKEKEAREAEILAAAQAEVAEVVLALPAAKRPEAKAQILRMVEAVAAPVPDTQAVERIAHAIADQWLTEHKRTQDEADALSLLLLLA